MSPFSGNAVCVDDQSGLITIFLSPLVKHEIVAPIDGIIQHIEGCQGKIIRPEITIFVADAQKNGRLSFIVKGDNISVQVWLELGKSWITHEMYLKIKNNDKVKQGDKLSELIIGSLGEIHFPISSKIKYLVEYGTELIARKNNFSENSMLTNSLKEVPHEAKELIFLLIFCMTVLSHMLSILLSHFQFQ